MKSTAIATPIEYFLWSREGTKNDKLIYYDQNGECHEKPIPSGILEKGLHIFDGKPRAVRRSSGGLVLAEPYQVVIYDRTVLSPETQWRPMRDPNSMIRIRVKFHDLVRSRDGLIISPQPVIQTKIVMLDELKDAFPTKIEAEQRFVMDFGRGIIPIHVFHFAEDEKGRAYALFARADEIEKALTAKEGEKVALQTFQIPQSVLRLTEKTGAEEKEYKAAQDNLIWLKQNGETIVPPCLKLGDEVEVPGGASLEMLQHFLRISTRPEDRASLEPLLIRVKNNEELLPFGLFEVA